MKRQHVIKRVPAGIFAGVVPHAVTTPAMVDMKFIQVITLVTYIPSHKGLPHKIQHIPVTIRSVTTAIDQEYLELFTVVLDLFLPGYL